MPVTIRNMTVEEFCSTYEGDLFHALLCDPPYHLGPLNARFSSETAAPAQYGTDGVFQRSSRGFMGKKWDGGDIAFRPETWHALATLLYPGSFGMAYAGSRGWHRMAVAIEDAGLIIHPSIFGYAYGSGFPKATRIDTQVDKAAGVDRPVIGKIGASRFNKQGRASLGGGWQESPDETAPATPMAERWAGHRYGAQALKPALEPIIVFQRPYEGRPIDNITETGAGALNIDGARIPTSDEPWEHQSATELKSHDDFFRNKRSIPLKKRGSIMGRWPANLIVSAQAAEDLDRQSGTLSSGKGDENGNIQPSTGIRYVRKVKHDFTIGYGNAGGVVKGPVDTYAYGDTGGASRFFMTYQEDQIDDADPLYYVQKAGVSERDAGLRGKYPCLICDRLDSEYHEIEDRSGKIRVLPCSRNLHPTIKPLELNRWLATLLLPPLEYAPGCLCRSLGQGQR